MESEKWVKKLNRGKKGGRKKRIAVVMGEEEENEKLCDVFKTFLLNLFHF